MKRLTLIVLLLLSLPSLAQRWEPEIYRHLKSGTITKTALLEDAVENWDGSNPYLLLTLDTGEQAVFRSEDEPWGSVAEACAYDLDRFLETDLVPPTVVRTFRKDDWPGKWPWKTEQRKGSLQLFVKGAVPTSLDRLNKEDRANSEILGFLIGRYDNHSGNLLRDPTGRAVMVDFENSLEIQKGRFGEFPFVKRGGDHPSPLMVSGDDPFPFDQPMELVNPDIAKIEDTFGPWWGQVWPQGMKGLARRVKGIPDRTIRYILWNNKLWIQTKIRSRHAYNTDYFPPKTVRKLRQLDRDALRAIFVKPYRNVHIEHLVGRKQQLINAASKS